MDKKMIDTIVKLLTDLPDSKAASVIDHINFLKGYGDNDVDDGVREALDLYSQSGVGQPGP